MVKVNAGGRCGDHRCDPRWLQSELSPSPSVVAASTPNREDHENADEHPQEGTQGEAPHQRQDDENDKQHDDEVHADKPTPESRARSSVAATEEVAGKPVRSDGSGLVDECVVWFGRRG